MRAALFIYMCAAAAACASATPGNPDARGGGSADAPPGTPDSPPGTPDADTPDAAPGTPDAMETPDAMPDAGVLTSAPDTCAQAVDITTAAHVAGGTTVAGDTTGYADDVEPDGCTGYTPDGPDAIYIVTLAANETLTATVTPTAWDVSLELSSNCVHAATCVAGADSGFDGDPETLTYVATAAGTFYLAVDGYNPGVAGPFSMNVHIQ